MTSSESLKFTTQEMHSLMGVAIEEAQLSSACGEVPVGAVLWRNGTIVARAHNETERTHNPTAHAECLAIQRACAHISNWRLHDSALFVTLEPCTMCIGAILLARISVLVFGAHDPRMGAVGSLYDVTAVEHHSKIRVISGIREDECRKMLTTFFQKRRS